MHLVLWEGGFECLEQGVCFPIIVINVGHMHSYFLYKEEIKRDASCTNTHDCDKEQSSQPQIQFTLHVDVKWD